MEWIKATLLFTKDNDPVLVSNQTILKGDDVLNTYKGVIIKDIHFHFKTPFGIIIHGNMPTGYEEKSKSEEIQKGDVVNEHYAYQVLVLPEKIKSNDVKKLKSLPSGTIVKIEGRTYPNNDYDYEERGSKAVIERIEALFRGDAYDTKATIHLPVTQFGKLLFLHFLKKNKRIVELITLFLALYVAFNNPNAFAKSLAYTYILYFLSKLK